MTKFVVVTLLSATALSGFAAAPAFADAPPAIECTSSTVSSSVPSGTYTDKNGHKWVGFTADGNPPNSLSKDSTSVSCKEIEWSYSG